MSAADRLRVLAALACHLALYCGPLAAQPTAQTTAQPAAPIPGQTPEQAALEGIRRQESRSRDQQKALEPQASELVPDAGKAGAAPKGEFPQDTPCFKVNELALTGQDAGRFGWLLDAAMPYLRRCVGVRGLSYIAAELDQQLRDRGYVTTRVGLPPQNLQSGQLQVHVQVGRVADIRMVNADLPTPQGQRTGPAAPDERWGTWRNAFPVAAGDVLNVRDLEQGVENMKRLPSQSVATRLEPGDVPGASVVIIERKAGGLHDRVRGGLTLDNSGGPSLGRAQLSANLAVDNPGGVNDVVSVGLNTNAQQPNGTHRSQGVTFNYSVPWGYGLLSLNASASRFAQYVQGTTVRFLSSGASSSAEARLQHTLWRDASAKLTGHVSVSTRRAESWLDDVEVVVQRRRTTNVEAGLNYKHLFEKSSLELDLAVRRGVSWRGAQDDFATAQAGGLTLRPQIWSLNGNWATGFALAGRALQYSASLRSQFTGDTTLSVDQIAIGGRSSVRGFDGDAALLAENGVVLRNEITTPLKLWDGLDITALLALDYGRVWGPSDVFLAGNRLAGLGLGLRGRAGSRQFEVTLATPLYRPRGFQSRRLNVYASLTQEF